MFPDRWWHHDFFRQLSLVIHRHHLQLLLLSLLVLHNAPQLVDLEPFVRQILQLLGPGHVGEFIEQFIVILASSCGEQDRVEVLLR